VNSSPHIGFALEVIQADALARYHRLKGDDTFYLTGTDEHGVKIYETAAAMGMETRDFVDGNAKKFEDLKEILNLSNDAFVRTSFDDHKTGAQKLWKKLVDSGDIYMGSYEGNYCVGCESFLPDKDLDEEGNCLIHKKKPMILKEENYFFKLSKYSDRIKEVIESGVLSVFRDSRKNEMLNIIGEEGLRDVSFSRPKAALPWGVDVPGDDSQVMYVWCDALSNYITALDYEHDGDNFKKYWPCDAHIIGKDILRFHAGIWIGMLMSAGIELPKAIYVHGFITSEGHKMSKSLGNVVDPLDYVEKYGVDALRYYLLREIPTTDDGDFSHERFLNVHNSELANGVGNLLNRVLMMVERYVDGQVPAATDDKDFFGRVDGFVMSYHEAFEGYDFKRACEVVVELVNFGNKYIDDKKPWVMVKEGAEGLSDVLYNLLELLRYTAVLLMPILPETAEKIAVQLALNEGDFNFDLKWGTLEEGKLINKGEPLFPRLEE